MILALDIGNTRIKWSLHDQGRFIREDAVALAALDLLDWSSVPKPSQVIGANVAGPSVQDTIERLTARWNLPVRWLVPGAHADGVSNGYEEPAQLGPDRWAALIGARARAKTACVVANSGTALTIDALSHSGEFLGGLILPGIDLMQQSLSDHTARLSRARGSWQIFPRNSGDAMTSGALNAAAGAIERMIRAMNRAGHDPIRVLLTGGNAALLLPLIPGVEHHERLVMEGLVSLAQEGAT
jgi:type III pantothenate kinase